MKSLTKQLKSRLKKIQTNSIQKNMRNISMFDRVAKKKWEKVFDQMKQKQNPEAQQQLISSKYRVQTQQIESIFTKRKNSKIQPGRICKQSIRRMKTLSNINVNQEIFYRKTKYEFPYNPTNKLRQQKKKAMLDNSQNKLNKDNQKKQDINLVQIVLGRKEIKQSVIPFMLRRRSNKVEKTLNIIDNRYKNTIKQIDTKGCFRYSMNLQEKKHLIESMKGSKVYYQFIKQWSTSQEEIL